jgi:hypothetical protein
LDVRLDVQLVKPIFASVTLELIAPDVRDGLGSRAAAQLITALPPFEAGLEGTGGVVVGDGD